MLPYHSTKYQTILLVLGLVGIFLVSIDDVFAQSEPESILKFGSEGIGDGEFPTNYGPYGIALDNSGNILVADVASSRIQIFDSSGNFVSAFGTEGSDNGQLKNPQDVAVDSSGNIIVADTNNRRIQVFDPSGNFLLKFGNFVVAVGVAVDSSDNIYVTDFHNNKVQKFDSSGNLLLTLDTAGTGDGELNRPHGIAIDSFGNIYVADNDNYRIQKFDSSGNFLLKFGTIGTGSGQFESPLDIGIDGSDNIYVTDNGNENVSIFDSSGNFLFEFGRLGCADGYFNDPFGIVIDNSGKIYVSENRNYRIQVFDKINFDSVPEAESPSPITISEPCRTNNKWFVVVDGEGFYPNLQSSIAITSFTTNNVKTDSDGSFSHGMESGSGLLESGIYDVIVTDINQHTFPMELKFFDFQDDAITWTITPGELIAGESTVIDVTGTINVDLDLTTQNEGQVIIQNSDGNSFLNQNFALMDGGMFHIAQQSTPNSAGEHTVFVIFDGLIRSGTITVLPSEPEPEPEPEIIIQIDPNSLPISFGIDTVPGVGQIVNIQVTNANPSSSVIIDITQSNGNLVGHLVVRATESGLVSQPWPVPDGVSGVLTVKAFQDIPEPEPVPEPPPPGVDQIPPELLLPADMIITGNDPDGTVITYSVKAIDNFDQILTPTCDPPSDSTFPLGVTVVRCTVTDSSGNTDQDAFKVLVEFSEFVVPKWVKDVAGFWCNDEIDDSSFIQAIQYLITTEVITVPTIESIEGTSEEIPDWIKNTACWWSQGLITDGDFVNGIQFLIENGIIQV